MSSSHVRNLYKICITIIKPLLNPYIPGTSDLQIDWRLKFKCSHWAAPLRAWGIGGRRHWWPMHGFPIYDLGSNCRLDPSLSKKCQEIESWWIMCDVPANSDQLFFRPGSYVVNMAYDFLWFPAGKVSKLPRKLCRLWLSKVSGARAAQTCAGGGRKVEALHWVMRDMVEASTLHLSILQITHLLSPEMIMWGYVGKVKGRYLQRVMGSVSHVVWYLHSKRFSHRLPLANSDAEISWSRSRSLWLLTILPRCAGRFACLPFWTSLPICSK